MTNFWNPSFSSSLTTSCRTNESFLKQEFRKHIKIRGVKVSNIQKARIKKEFKKKKTNRGFKTEQCSIALFHKL